MLQTLYDLQILAVRPHRITENQPLFNAVAAVRTNTHRKKLAFLGGRNDISDCINHGIGSRSRRGKPAHLNNFCAALLNGLNKRCLQPLFIGDNLQNGSAGNRGMIKIRKLSRGMVAPDRHVLNIQDSRLRLLRQLRISPVLIQHGHGKKIFRRNVGGRCLGDIGIGIAGIAHH